MEHFKNIERKILRVEIKNIDQTQACFAPVYAKFDETKFKGVGTADVYLHTNVGTEIVTCALVRTRNKDNERFFVISANKRFSHEVTSQIVKDPNPTLNPKRKPLQSSNVVSSLTNIGLAPDQDVSLMDDLATRKPKLTVYTPSPDFLARYSK